MLVFVRDLSFKTCCGYEKYGAVANDDFQVFSKHLRVYKAKLCSSSSSSSSSSTEVTFNYIHAEKYLKTLNEYIESSNNTQRV